MQIHSHFLSIALWSGSASGSQRSCCHTRSALLAGKDTKKETKLGLSATKASDFGEWYSQVVVESEMISYYDVSGAASVSSPLCVFPAALACMFQLTSKSQLVWILFAQFLPEVTCIEALRLTATVGRSSGVIMNSCLQAVPACAVQKLHHL